jgi:phosphoglucomutase
VEDFFENLYECFGYHGERLHTVTLPGASGEGKIRAYVQSLKDSPHRVFADWRVEKRLDFATDEILDEDGKKIPNQDLQILYLEGGYSVAIRGSGTEPKIKFYLFAEERGKNLPLARKKAEEAFGRLQTFIGEDLERRTAIKNR